VNFVEKAVPEYEDLAQSRIVQLGDPPASLAERRKRVGRGDGLVENAECTFG